MLNKIKTMKDRKKTQIMNTIYDTLFGNINYDQFNIDDCDLCFVDNAKDEIVFTYKDFGKFVLSIKRGKQDE